MTLMQRTSKYSRVRLELTREGVRTVYERPAVGGGWYNEMHILVPWPWKSFS